jgi:hypothetical protein
LAGGWLSFHHFPNTFVYSLAISCATLTIYNFQRLYNSEGVNTDEKDALHWMNENRKAMVLVTILSAFCTSVSSFFLMKNNMNDFAVLALGLALSIFYVVPVRNKNLRTTPFLKTPLISLVWVLVLFVLPTVNEGKSLVYFLPEFIGLYFLIAAMTIPFDIRDLKVDYPHQKTVPQLVGIKGSKILALSFLAVYCIITAKINVEMREKLSFWILTFGIAGLILMANRERSLIYFGLVDMMMLLLGLVYFFN